jgi:hypothetical protein
MNITTPRRTSAAAAAAAFVLTSCGMLPGDPDFLDQSPRSMAKAAFADMRNVSSVRILGSLESDAGFMRVDLRVDDTSCAGNLDLAVGNMRLRKNSHGAWFSGDENFWRASTSSARADSYAGAWVAIPQENGMLELCDLDALLDSFKLDKDDTEDTIEVGEVEKIGDADAVALTGQEGKERTTVWVAVESPHRVLKMAPADDTGRPDELYFEEFGAVVVAESPPEKRVVEPLGE